MTRTYHSITIKERDEALVDLAVLGFRTDPKYFQLGYADTPELLARRGVAERLSLVRSELASSQVELKIWDAWRSRDIQQRIYRKFWLELQLAHPEFDDSALKVAVSRFVANPCEPSKIPPHATGGAVDLTLVDSAGNELEMGTAFDHFGEEAGMYYFDRVDKQISDNRKLLREAMQRHGFTFYEHEWWHFDYGNQCWADAANVESAIYGEASLVQRKSLAR